MLKLAKREFLLNFDGLWQSALIVGGAWLLGEIIFFCIVYFTREQEYFPLATLMACITLTLCLVLFPAYYFSCGYEQALSMGCSRRRFLLGMSLALVGQIVCYLALVCVLAAAEYGLFRLLCPRGFASAELAELAALGQYWWALLLLPLEVLCVGLLLGALVQRWGRRALWGLWGVYMAVVLLGAFAPELVSGAPRDTLLLRALGGLFDLASRIPESAVPLAALLLFPACGAVGAGLLLRGSVRQAS